MTYNPQKPDADPISLDKRIAEQENVDYSTLATKEYLDSKTGGSTGGGSSSGGTSSGTSGTGLLPNKTIIDWSVVKEDNTFYECEQGLVCCFKFPTGTTDNNSVILRAWCFAPKKWNGFVARMRIVYLTACHLNTGSSPYWPGFAGDSQDVDYYLREVDFPIGNKELFFQMYENFRQVYSTKPIRLFFQLQRQNTKYQFKYSYSCFLDVENEKLYIADKTQFSSGNYFCLIGIEEDYDIDSYLGTYAYAPGYYKGAIFSAQTYGTSNLYNNKGTVFLGRPDLGRVSYSPYFMYDNFSIVNYYKEKTSPTDPYLYKTTLDACGMFLTLCKTTDSSTNYKYIAASVRNYLPDEVSAKVEVR